MKKITLIALLLVSALGMAQDEVAKSEKELAKEKKVAMNKYYFEEVFVGFSGKKTSIVTLKNGETYRGFGKGVERKKGQIYEIEFKDSVTGKKNTYKAEEIAEMYLYPNNFDKIGKMNKFLSNSKNWSDKSAKKITNKGYVCFKNELVSLKNKKDDKEYLMQLINPEFNSIFSVYGDPNAKETGGVSVGIGGMMSPQFGGGMAKSYYVKKGDKIFWLHKSDFKESYNELFGDNATFIAQYPYEKIDWDNLSFLILEYTRIVEAG